MSYTKYDLSIVVACYNEEGHLIKSIEEIREVMNCTPYTYELIFIDDCSQDKTREIIKELCKGHGNCRFYFHEQNVGRGGTVREGLLAATGKYAGFLDIDLEVHARYIPSMISALNKGYDVATAYRVYNLLQLDGAFRVLLSICYRFLVRLCLGIHFKDTEAGYKFFNLKTTRHIIAKTQNPKWFWDTEIIGLLLANNKRIKQIPCLFLRNTKKESTVRILPDIVDYIKAIRMYKNHQKIKLSRYDKT
jgi:glycosyltransferase involved in cell wall biosynthesis